MPKHTAKKQTVYSYLMQIAQRQSIVDNLCGLTDNAYLIYFCISGQETIIWTSFIERQMTREIDNSQRYSFDFSELQFDFFITNSENDEGKP